MPIANAPTLGRNRSSVRIATRKPEPGSPRICARAGVDAVESQRADRVRREQLEALPGQPLGVACDRERRQPSRSTRVGIRAREHGVDVGVGGVGDPQLVAVQQVATVAVGLRAQAQPGRIGACVGLGQRERRDRRSRRDARQPSLAQLGAAGLRRSGRRRAPAARTPSRPRCTPARALRGSGTGRSPRRGPRRRARTASPAVRARPAPRSADGSRVRAARRQRAASARRPRADGCRRYSVRWASSRCSSSAADELIRRR